MVVLLCFSALISGAEVAFFSLTPSELDPPDDDPNARGVRTVRRLLADPKKLLATILVANNLINIAIVLLFAGIGERLLGDIQIDFYGINLRFIIEVVVVTFLILLFGEILPKVYASRNSVKFSAFMSGPISVLDKLFTPISLPMKTGTVAIENRFGRRKSSLSIDQLSQALELTDHGETTLEEQKILQGIVTFGNTDTKQVMRPRMEIFALNEEMGYQEVISAIVENGYSRIPVYKDSIDNITGILYAKDLIPHLEKKTFKWNQLKREAYFVPENKKLDDLLTEFKQMKMHLAIVVDEYGGTSGLISLEDIIEEIVGEISDEFDDEDLIFSKLDDTNYVFEGKTPMKDFYKVIELDDPQLFEDARGESETLAGFLLEISKGFPRKNEVIKFHHYAFTIEAFDNKRIKQVKLSINA
jgi:gliding motility-associated protein GldE